MNVALLLALLVLGCSSTAEQLGHEGTYFRDERTGLCFIYWQRWVVVTGAKGSGSGATTIASNVPCNPTVLALIEAEEKTQ